MGGRGGRGWGGARGGRGGRGGRRGRPCGGSLASAPPAVCTTVPAPARSPPPPTHSPPVRIPRPRTGERAHLRAGPRQRTPPAAAAGPPAQTWPTGCPSPQHRRRAPARPHSASLAPCSRHLARPGPMPAQRTAQGRPRPPPTRGNSRASLCARPVLSVSVSVFVSVSFCLSVCPSVRLSHSLPACLPVFLPLPASPPPPPHGRTELKKRIFGGVSNTHRLSNIS